MGTQTKKDTYQKWKESGQLDQVLSFIKDCARKLITQREMCEYLKINEATFVRLKKKYPEIEVMQQKAKLELKKDLVGALYKKAMGYEVVEEEQFIEDRGKGKEQKRKIHRTKKQIQPDYKSIIYLLTKNFGRDFNERKDELDLMEKKLTYMKEEWSNGREQETEYSSEEDS